MTTRSTYSLLILGVSIGVHFIGDYGVQRLFSSFFRAKKSSFFHLLAHCAVADGPSFALIGSTLGAEGALAGFIVGACAHCAVDIFQLRGSLPHKLVDQALHICAITAYLVLLWH